MNYENFIRYAITDNWVHEVLQKNLAKIEPPEIVKTRIIQRARWFEIKRKLILQLFSWVRGPHRGLTIQTEENTVEQLL